MAASSDRIPPPFPDTEEPGVCDMADGDRDEGEDVFVNDSNPVSRGVSRPDNEQPPDLFREEEEAKEEEEEEEASSTTAKYNGVHSDDDSDLFAEAQVEQSTDKASGSARKELSTSSGPPPSSSVTQSPAATQPSSSQQLEEEEDMDFFDVDVAVTNPEKIGDGMNAYVAYKVSTRTSLAMFRSKAFSVRRRFSDFLGLYEKLSVKQSLQGCIIPPPPEKSVVGMTKVKVGMDDPSSVEFVERRRAALERYLQRVVSHPSLLQDPDVRDFLERDELPRAVSTQALSGAGFLKMFNKASDAVNKMTIKMNESDTWFEDKFQEVENEEQQLRKLQAVVDSLVNHRKELCGSTAVFAKSMAMLGNSEDNTALSRALSQLAEVEDKMEQLHQEQAASDFFIFAELLADYIRLLAAMRGCFDQRVRAWQRWQEAQSTLQKKREAEAKLLWANKPDKLQQAKDEISEWESRVTQYERDFDRIGMTVRKEVLRFEKEKAKDFRGQIVKYLDAMLQSQQRLVKFWEAFLPEAKAIA
ncbi:sorting nexin-1 [Spinachia spinachia]